MCDHLAAQTTTESYTVGNSHRRGYPSHHDSVQGQAKYDRLAVPMALRPSEQTEHKPEHPNAAEHTH